MVEVSGLSSCEKYASYLCTKHLESDDLHAKDRGIEVDGVWYTFHCKNQMIETAHLNWTRLF